MPAPWRVGAVLAALCAFPAPALAGTASLKTVAGKPDIVTVEYAAGAGERVDVTASIVDGEVSFRDTAAAPKGSDGCIAALDTVRCVVPRASEIAGGRLLFVTVRGGDGNDRVRVARPGDTGNSFLVVLLGAAGGAGDDDLTVDSPPDPTEFKPPLAFTAIEGGDGQDSLGGGEGRDLLAGGSGRDILRGGVGDDLLGGDLVKLLDPLKGLLVDPEQGADKQPDPEPETAGDDTLDGGAGDDTADYAGHQARVVVNLADPGADGSAGESDVLTSVENVSGGNFGNDLTGDGGDNGLFGGKGADHLAGGDGDDGLFGSVGDNRLEGGAGDDLLDGLGRKTSCGPGTDYVVQQNPTALDGLALRRDCEFANFGLFEQASALRIRALRVSRGGLLLPVLAFESIDAADRKITVKLSKPGAGTIATGTVTLPAGTARGRAATLRLKLGPAAQRKLRGLRRVRVRLSSQGYSTTIDLPLRR